MTPKDKARELYGRFLVVVCYSMLAPEIAKECAQTCVDEILDECYEEDVDWWLEVKNEIRKI